MAFLPLPAIFSMVSKSTETTLTNSFRMKSFNVRSFYCWEDCYVIQLAWLVVGEILNICLRKMNNAFLLFKPSFGNFCFRLVRCYMRDCWCCAHVKMMILLKKLLIFSLGGICCFCLKNSDQVGLFFFFGNAHCYI